MTIDKNLYKMQMSVYKMTLFILKIGADSISAPILILCLV
nr:MAG TPA: hypothetical protein [Caudoviricetes sp.]